MFVSIIIIISMIGFKSTSAQFGFGGAMPSIDVSQTQTESNEDLAKKYFKHYGYTLTLELTDAQFDAALSAFRIHHQMASTGSISSEDVTEMKRARCSMPDKYQLFTDPSKPLVETDVDVGRKVEGTVMREWDAVAIVKRQANTDDTFLQCQETIHPETGKQKRMFTWCLAGCIDGFCDIDGMRATITAALEFWKSITQLDFAEISCPGQTGFWGAECGDDQAVCDSADFKFAFANIDRTGGDLSLTCSITKPGGPPVNPICTAFPGYVFFDSLEVCPDGTPKWILEATSCPAPGEDVCERWNWKYILIHTIGHLLGMEECGSGVMAEVYQCVVGDVPVDPCITTQIAEDCPNYNQAPDPVDICDQFCDHLEDPEACNADCDIRAEDKVCYYAAAGATGDDCQLCTMGEAAGFDCNATTQVERNVEHDCCREYCRGVHGEQADGRCTQAMDQCVCSSDGTPLDIWGEPAYRTADGRTFTYHGTCPVLALKLCTPNPNYPEFAIYQKNYCVQNCNPADTSAKVSSTLWVELEVFGQRFRLSLPVDATYIPLPLLEVNDQPVALPFVWSNNNGEFVRAMLEGMDGILLYTSFGIKIWTGTPVNQRKFHFMIPDSPGFINNTCGILGMFNKDPSDDLRFKNGSIVTVPTPDVPNTQLGWLLKHPVFEEYGNSWIDETVCNMDSGKPLATCADALFAKAEGLCAQLKNETGPFGQCIAYYNARTALGGMAKLTVGMVLMGGPESFYEQCLYDVCQLNNPESALENGACDSYSVFENACGHPHIQTTSPVGEWKRPDFCAMNCNLYPFSEEKPCATKCPPTCTQPDAPERCSAVCAPGCQCIEGFFWQTETASCIPEVACPVECLM